MKVLTDGKIALGKTKAWFGSNKVELTKDTVYTHPSTKQCGYNVDLSNYVTQSDIEAIKKELSDVGAKLVGSMPVYADRRSTSAEVTYSYDFDYVEIIPASVAVGLTNGGATFIQPPVAICKNCSGVVSFSTCDDSGNATVNHNECLVKVTQTSTRIELKYVYVNSFFGGTINFYKYTS